MKFSIIIPVYNTEKYVEECIQSVLNQTCQDYELVLVNDGSTDGSRMVCEKFVRDNPGKIVLINQRNQGQLAARYSGIQASKGEYCLFLDSDDLLVQDAIEYLNNIVVKYNTPDVMIYTLLYQYDNGEQIQSKKLFEGEKYFSRIEEKAHIQKELLFGTLLNSVCTKAVKRDILLKCDWELDKYGKLRCAEDRLQSMMIVDKAETFVYSPKSLYQYRMVVGSTTRTYNFNTIERFNTKEMCKVEESFLEQWNLFDEKNIACLRAGFMNQTMYVYFDFFKHVRNIKIKYQLGKYKWAGFVEDEYFENFNNNQYISPIYKKMWNYILRKKFLSLFLYSQFRVYYLLLRDLKRKLL